MLAWFPFRDFRQRRAAAATLVAFAEKVLGSGFLLSAAPGSAKVPRSNGWTGFLWLGTRSACIHRRPTGGRCTGDMGHFGPHADSASKWFPGSCSRASAQTTSARGGAQFLEEGNAESPTGFYDMVQNTRSCSADV